MSNIGAHLHPRLTRAVLALGCDKVGPLTQGMLIRGVCVCAGTDAITNICPGAF